MIELALLSLLVLTNIGWSWWNWKQSSTFHSHTQGFYLMKRINDEINARSKTNTVYIDKTPQKPTDPRLGTGKLVDDGADILANEQPPAITMSHIIDEAAELERELRRPRNENIEWETRDGFAAHHPTEDA